jgi:hypothetical protein
VEEVNWWAVRVLAREKKEINLLDMKPKRTSMWKRGEKVTIIVPKAKTIIGKHICDFVGKPRTFKLNLDEYGSAVWKLCNGDRTVREIGDELERKFGKKVEPVYERLKKFLHILEAEKLIKYV